jgi:cell division protein FtsB
MGDHIDFQKVALWLMGLLLGMLAYFGKRHVARIDKLEADRSQHVSRDELAQIMVESRQERAEQFRVIQDMISRTHSRVDEVYRNMGKGRGG